VQDKKGRPVIDLTPDDFEIREDGAAQKIDHFYLVDAKTPARPVAALEGAPNQIPANSNAAPAARTPPVFVAFFDDDHLTPGGFKRVQAAALSLFTKQFKTGDIGGVVYNGRMSNDRLTTEREELLKAVRDAKPSSKANSRRFDEQQWPRLTDVQATRIVVNGDRAVLAQAIERACADEPTLCPNAELAVRGKASQLTDETRGRTVQTIQKLLAVPNGLTRMDGRKTVLLLTEGFLADESWPLVKDAVGAAARADARLYTLDARGLDRAGMAAHLGDSDPGAFDSSARLLNQFDYAADAINSLAVDTGGFVVRNTNIFTDAVAQIAADANTYYVLGYRPVESPDGKFRRLAVKVNRPGVIVRARRGYVAAPKPARTTNDGARGSTLSPGRGQAGSPRADVEPPGEAKPMSPPQPRDAAATPARPEAYVATPARPEPVEGRASESVPMIRLRPNAVAHVQTLGPGSAGDADADAGWEAYKRGDVETARRTLGVAARRPSAAPWVHYAFGQSAYALKQYQEAVGAWEHVRRSTPEFEPVYFDLVDGYLQMKEHDRALRVLRDASQRWPHDAEVFNALGVVQVSRSAYDDAEGSFEKAIAAAPAEGVGYFNLAKVLELRYWKSRRYVQQTRTWVANAADRDNAIARYRRYLEIGGTFENSAREGLARLGWEKSR
jgi:VWFA-related protein